SPSSGVSIVNSGGVVSNSTVIGSASPVTSSSNDDIAVNSLSPSSNVTGMSNTPSSLMSISPTTLPSFSNVTVVVGDAVPVTVTTSSFVNVLFSGDVMTGSSTSYSTRARIM